MTSSRLTQFTHDGLTFEVSDSGPVAGPLDGEAVVLLHGFPQDRHCWRAVRERLEAAGLRCLAPDQRGYSPSASPAEVSAYAMRHLVGDVVGLLDAAGLERAHIVGHDWGGGVAWSLAAAHPDRVASLTVLSTPHPSALGWAFLRKGQVARSWYMGAFQLPGAPERLLASRLAGLERAGLPAAEAQRYGRRFATPGSLRGPINWYRAAARSRGLVGSGEGPSVVGVPTTYVWGSRDRYLGRAAAEKTSEFVGADYRFVEVDDNHWLPEVRPDLVADEVLARVRGDAVDDPAVKRLGDAEFVSLTTYKRSGEPVSNPMWVARDGNELVFTTVDGSWKVKRLRRDPRVRVAVSDRRGRVRPGALTASGTARLAGDEATLARAGEVLRGTYGVQFSGLLKVESVAARGKRERVILRVELDSSPE